MPNLLIRGGHVLDPTRATRIRADVAIADNRIAEIAPDLARSPADRVIDAEGCLVTPGLIDPHVHLREPGGEAAETIATGTRAAVWGGFTTVCCMPNTNPCLDTDVAIAFVLRRARKTGLCRVFPVGAATKGRRGEDLAEIGLMVGEGAVGISDDGDCVASAGMMSRVLGACSAAGVAFMQHCQDPTMTRGASMHAGSVSVRLGLTGWPRAAEEIIIERDVRLAASSGCAYHVQHLSSAASVDIVKRARDRAAPGRAPRVTAEATPHHLLLTHEEVLREGGYWTLAKMNPPLREDADVRALRQAVADGIITVLATDHAPHPPESKETDFESASFGIIGLQTALGLYAEALVHSGAISWDRLVQLMTIEPARLCGLDRASRGNDALGELFPGGPADVTVIDPDAQWTVDPSAMPGLSKNTPFAGRRLRGRAVATIVAGSVAFEAAAEIQTAPR